MRERHVLWAPIGGPGLEHLHLRIGADRIVADGLIVSVAEGTPVRLRYTIVCDPDWLTREVSVEVHGAGYRRLALRADGRGHWAHASGDDLPALDGCLDVDLTATAATNTLPIRRLDLRAGRTREIRAAWVHAPQLTLEAARQRYRCLERGPDGARYIFEGLGIGFRAEIGVDADGLVIDYPGLFTRVWSA